MPLITKLMLHCLFLNVNKTPTIDIFVISNIQWMSKGLYLNISNNNLNKYLIKYLIYYTFFGCILLKTSMSDIPIRSGLNKRIDWMEGI